jgi:beta-RFAP synthase
MIDMRGDLGRLYGSVGVAIDNPRIILEAEKSSNIVAKGLRSERVEIYAKKLLSSSGINEGVQIELFSDIMEHSGFGSGTQLALAVGSAISRLYGLDMKVKDLAMEFDRSRRSGVGTYVFKYGGFIIDGGHRITDTNGIPPLLFRSNIPENWRFVVGVPKIPLNQSGTAESNAFKKLESPPASLIGEISRIILMQMIPAILEEDIITFGEAMTSVDNRFGEFWLEIQGGRFSDPSIEDGINYLENIGATGVGQSSWGPAFYGLTEGDPSAKKICRSLEKFLNDDGKIGKAFVSKPDNNGAVITTIDN